MFVNEIAPDVHVHAETEDALALDRTDINFEDLTEDIVRITVRIHNRGRLRSAPTTVRLESAPLGAFVPWQALATLPLPPIEPGQSHVVSVDAGRPMDLARVKFNRLPPPGTFPPFAPETPARDMGFERALTEWIIKHRARWRGRLQRPPVQGPAMPAASAIPLASLRQVALQRQIKTLSAPNLQTRVSPPAALPAESDPVSILAAARQRRGWTEQMRVNHEISRIMKGERPVPERAWAMVRRWTELNPQSKINPIGPDGLPIKPFLVNAVRLEIRQKLAARLNQQLAANPGRPVWRGPALAGSPMDAQARRHFYWAGNINVFVGNRPPVERHMANGTRIYPGLVNTALFEVGGDFRLGRPGVDGPDAFSFQLKGSAAAWQAGLYLGPGGFASIYQPPTGKPMEEGRWYETVKMMMITLRMSPPADCGPGNLEVHVTRRSSASTAVVEFTLDPEAPGAGCYHV